MCLEQHLGNIKHSINVAMITLSRKTFEFSKTLTFFTYLWIRWRYVSWVVEQAVNDFKGP